MQASLFFLSQRICASNSFFWLLPPSINRNPPCCTLPCYTLDLPCSKEATFHSLDVSHSVSGLNGIILWYFDPIKDCWPPVGAWREHKWALFGIIWNLELSGTIWNYFDSIKDCWPAAGAGEEVAQVGKELWSHLCFAFDGFHTFASKKVFEILQN